MTEMPTTGRSILRAAWLATMDGPVIGNGAVLIGEGRVLVAGPAADVRAVAPDAKVEDVGDAVLLPGLVNAHAHLDLTHVSRPAPPDRFVDWLAHVMSSAVGDAAAAVRDGAAQCIRFGVTTVGDISRYAAAAREILRYGPVRAVSYGEVVGMAGRRHLLPGLLQAAVGDSQDSDNVARAVSPHAPYSIDAHGYRQCVAAADLRPLPLCTHLAETPDERAFLSHHAGPFRELWDRIGGWDGAAVPRFPGSPVAYAGSLGLLDRPATALAHVNDCDDDDLALLARGRASVVYCPRTHAYFGRPPHRWRDMLAAGVNVAVGTDSCASSPDLNLVDDLRLLRRLAPDVPPATLWEMATVRAALAIGREASVGTISPGKWADMAAFPAAASSTDPLTDLLETPTPPTAVWIGGRRIPPADVR